MKNKKTIDYKVGTVLTKLNDRTLSVVVYEKYKEKKYFKIRYKEKRILVHDYHNECSTADVVLIRRCKRVGRWKNYMVSTNLSLFWSR
uniref:Ribosomal protein L17 n=1 Tax=Nitzschia putrida TaxID=2742595 RepID=A0A7R7YPF3_9STRA|nr:ribosomal protein L17 [Nitzschia putrida]